MKPQSKPSFNASSLLSERLKELGINPAGLPQKVQGALKIRVEKELQSAQQDLKQKVGELHRKMYEQLQKAVSRAVTFRSIGNAFGHATTPEDGGGEK